MKRLSLASNAVIHLLIATSVTALLFSHATSIAGEPVNDTAGKARTGELVCVERAVGPQHHTAVARSKTFCRRVEKSLAAAEKKKPAQDPRNEG